MSGGNLQRAGAISLVYSGEKMVDKPGVFQ